MTTSKKRRGPKRTFIVIDTGRGEAWLPNVPGKELRLVSACGEIVVKLETIDHDKYANDNWAVHYYKKLRHLVSVPTPTTL